MNKLTIEFEDGTISINRLQNDPKTRLAMRTGNSSYQVWLTQEELIELRDMVGKYLEYKENE